MTTVYFIRHAQPDATVHDDHARPLTAKGMADRKLVTAYLRDKQIDAVLSSPYVRAVDTVADFAEEAGLTVETVWDFRERKPDDTWLPDEEFHDFMKRQWADFSYSRDTGESLRAVQTRNIAALRDVLARFDGKNIVVGTHGTALSTIINYYDCSFGYAQNRAMLGIMPWVVVMRFDGQNCAGMEKLDLLNPAADDGTCRVETADIGALKGYRYTVVFARYQGKWLYCRAKKRDTFETAGGKIEHGEMPLEGARREFIEETGAVDFDITPAFDYAVHWAHEYSNGRVFLAEVRALGGMPPFEMAEVKTFDTIPDKMRFPQILPVLFERIRHMARFS